MVTFEDIKFNPHPIGNGVQGKLFFPGGYGISVTRFKVPSPISKDFFRYGSYTSNENEWEVAILKGDENDWDICYDTHFTSDVLGYQTKEDINKIISHLIRMH
jgi:hypothetical protein